MSAWFVLQPRERWVVVGGTLFLLAALVATLFWLPLQERLTQEKKNLTERVAALQWMQRATHEVARLQKQQGADPSHQTGSPPSVLTVIDQTAQAQGLGDALSHVQSESSARVRLSLEKVAFDHLMRWLAVLDRQHRVYVQRLTMAEEGTPGYIRATLVLGGRAPP